MLSNYFVRYLHYTRLYLLTVLIRVILFAAVCYTIAMPEKKTALIIDDDLDLCEAMSDILTFKGYATVLAHNGKEGLALALEHKPDIILVDIRMPDMSGFELIRELRKDAWGITAKILILTASADPSDIPEDLNIGPHDFLLKTEWGIDGITSKIAEKLQG